MDWSLIRSSWAMDWTRGWISADRLAKELSARVFKSMLPIMNSSKFGVNKAIKLHRRIF
jgi:hypothetical protein